MKKLFMILAVMLMTTPGRAYQISSSDEYGTGDARNQNIIVNIRK